MGETRLVHRSEEPQKQRRGVPQSVPPDNRARTGAQRMAASVPAPAASPSSPGQGMRGALFGNVPPAARAALSPRRALQAPLSACSGLGRAHASAAPWHWEWEGLPSPARRAEPLHVLQESKAAAAPQ
eukprot:3640605-Prymnesium_polylepis.1